jgi:hypothetical protein
MSSIKEKLVKKKTFIKYLISYMLVFILPILLILFHFYPETTKIIKKEAQGSEAVLLSQINDYVSIQVDSLFNCASAIPKTGQYKGDACLGVAVRKLEAAVFYVHYFLLVLPHSI